MSYYTYFTLKVIDGDPDLSQEDYEELITERSQHMYNVFEDEVTWYDYEKEMKAFSRLKRNRDVVFAVSGNGEEFPDLWTHFFKNGKEYKQKARLLYPKFNKNKLA